VASRNVMHRRFPLLGKSSISGHLAIDAVAANWFADFSSDHGFHMSPMFLPNAISTVDAKATSWELRPRSIQVPTLGGERAGERDQPASGASDLYLTLREAGETALLPRTASGSTRSSNCPDLWRGVLLGYSCDTCHLMLFANGLTAHHSNGEYLV
jgi:hypothetical protein